MEYNQLKGERDIYEEFDELKMNYKSFKKRVSTIANLIIPGVGHVIYDKSILKGVSTFCLFIFYCALFLNKLSYETNISVIVIYFIPALAIWLGSTLLLIVDNDE